MASVLNKKTPKKTIIIKKVDITWVGCLGLSSYALLATASISIACCTFPLSKNCSPCAGLIICVVVQVVLGMRGMRDSGIRCDILLKIKRH